MMVMSCERLSADDKNEMAMVGGVRKRRGREEEERGREREREREVGG